MIFAFIFVILLFFAIKWYHDGEKKRGAVIYFFFLSNGFYVVPYDVLGSLPINKLTDFGTLYLIYVALSRYWGHTSRLKSTGYEMKWFGWLFVYLTILFLWTVALNQEIFSMSLATYRTYFCLLSFLILQELNKEELKWVFKTVMVITIIATILYIIQPVIGIKTIALGSISETNSSGLARYRNIPYLAYYFLVFATLTLKFTSIKKILLFLLFAVALVLTQHRGIMIGYMLAVSIYLLMERKVKLLMQYAGIGLILFLTVGSVILERFTEAETKSDFKAVSNLNYKKVDITNNNEGGTLTFRILMLIERADYLLQHPQYLLQGVGMRHEDSPYTQRDFDFTVCSRKRMGSKWGFEQISTGDLVWVTPLIKFGLIGLGFHIVITILMILFFFRHRQQSLFAKIAFYYYLLLILISFKNEQLFSPIHLFMIFLAYQIIQKEALSRTKTIKNKILSK